ncbi:MAG: hypothetical protein CMQ10_06520 [Gammaproteobacteria bacterium]|nr:hypothetical protein [Gammaproteobacteria bacterium]
MTDLLSRVAELSALPDEVCARIHGAREVVGVQQVQIALDRFAVTLTARLQDKNPLVIALLPDSAFLLGALLQRTVFAQQVLFAEMSDSGLRSVGTWPSLQRRTVVLLDGARSGAIDYQRIVSRLTQQAAGTTWLCRLIETSAESPPNGFDESLSVIVCDECNVFGCGLDVLGYCRNLPSLYAHD